MSGWNAYGRRAGGTGWSLGVMVLAAALVLVVVAGVAAATGVGVGIGGAHQKDARLSCPGGMARLSHVFDEHASVFPGDPAPVIDVVFTVEDDGYRVEEVTTGTHTGTHLDVPSHFVEGGTSVDDVAAEDLVWPSYVIDVRARTAVDPDFQLTWDEIRDYEKANGTIPQGAMVVLWTGFEDRFGTPGYLDTAPGLSAAAVQELFDRRHVGGVGSDTFGPDASSDVNFDATYTALVNDGLVLTNLRGLDALSVRGDILMAPAVRLSEGSGYQVDVLACLAR